MRLLKTLIFLISSIISLFLLLFLLDLTDFDTKYLNRSILNIDFKNLNSRHSYNFAHNLRHYYLKIYKVINNSSYENRWAIESEKVRLSLPKEKIIYGIKNNFSSPIYSIEDYKIKNDWYRSHGNYFSTRFSNLSTINTENANKMKLAWKYEPKDEKNYISNVQSNSIFYEGVIYTSNSLNQLIAINGKNGQIIWKFNIDTGIAAKRGLIIWIDKKNNSSRIFFTNNRKKLFCLDAKTGKLVENFGKSGVLEIGLTPLPPVIYNDEIIIITAKSIIKTYNLYTGKLKWKYKVNKTKNSILFENFKKGSPWGGLSVDEKRGLLFFTTGNPEQWHVGVDRPGDNLYANSIVAFNLNKKKIEWYFQEIPHDLWNMDIAAPPVLTMIKRNNKLIDVVVAVTKLGNTIVLDRISGKPIYDIIMKRAPVTDVPGEKTAEYQIDISLPEPVCRNKFKREYLSQLISKDDKKIKKIVNNSEFGFPNPPKIKKKNIQLASCVRWAGASVDSEKNILYVSVDQSPVLVSIIKHPWFKGLYTHKWEKFVDSNNYPAIEPPWGAIVALNLNSGKIIWKVPFGEWSELTKSGANITGTKNRSGITASSGNLIFASGTHDNKFRVYNSINGKELWSYNLSHPGSSPPTIYEIDNKQYVVVSAFENGGKNIYAFTLNN